MRFNFLFVATRTSCLCMLIFVLVLLNLNIMEREMRFDATELLNVCITEVCLTGSFRFVILKILVEVLAIKINQMSQTNREFIVN